MLYAKDFVSKTELFWFGVGLIMVAGSVLIVYSLKQVMPAEVPFSKLLEPINIVYASSIVLAAVSFIKGGFYMIQVINAGD